MAGRWLISREIDATWKYGPRGRPVCGIGSQEKRMHEDCSVRKAGWLFQVHHATWHPNPKISTINLFRLHLIHPLKSRSPGRNELERWIPGTYSWMSYCDRNARAWIARQRKLVRSLQLKSVKGNGRLEAGYKARSSRPGYHRLQLLEDRFHAGLGRGWDRSDQGTFRGLDRSSRWMSGLQVLWISPTLDWAGTEAGNWWIHVDAMAN